MNDEDRIEAAERFRVGHESPTKLAREFSVSRSTIYRLPDPTGGGEGHYKASPRELRLTYNLNDIFDSVPSVTETVRLPIEEQSVAPMVGSYSPGVAVGKAVAQRMDGYIYLLRAENGYYKIGRSVEISKRLASLQRDFPIAIKLVYSYRHSDYIKEEARLHSLYKEFRKQGEWFALPPKAVRAIRALGKISNADMTSPNIE